MEILCEGLVTPVFLDTDIGSNVDDLLALLMLGGAQEIDLVGVTTVYGDTALRAEVARRTLCLMGKGDIPIAAGAEEPRSKEPVFWTGHEGAAFGRLAPFKPTDGTALELFATMLDRHGPELVLIGIGPFTNIASFAELAVSLKKPFRELLVMGGQFGDGPPDRNVRSDVRAAHDMKESLAYLGVPIRYVGIDLCRMVWLTQHELDEIAPPSNEGTVSSLVRDEIETWWAFLDQRRSNPCDPLTVLALLEPHLLRFATARVEFSEDRHEYGATRWIGRDAENDSLGVKQAHWGDRGTGLTAAAESFACAVESDAATAGITRRLAAVVASSVSITDEPRAEA